MKQKLAFAIVMASINASLISFILTAYNAGFPDDFLYRWAMNFLIAFCIVVPSIVFIGPLVQRFTTKILSDNP